MGPPHAENSLLSSTAPLLSKQCSHGQYCVRCKYASPVIVAKILPWLERYPLKDSASTLREGFSKGFKLGYSGVRSSRDSTNLKSVQLDPAAVLVKLDKEISLGRIAGPFKYRPLKNLMVSPIGLVPKSEPGSFRLIQHLSFPHGSSVNDGIDPDMCSVKYAEFDVAVGLVAGIGRGAFMAKADIKSAFRLLPVHPSDFEILGIKVENQYYVDKALPMGASCSPALFEKFSTFIEWVTKKVSGSDSITHFADDYLFVGAEGESRRSCSSIVKCFEQVCQEFGVPLASEKSVGPSTSLVYLGLQIDSVQQTVSVPSGKVASISSKVDKALQANKLTLRELQSLIGSLSFVCKAVAPGRAFLRRLIDLTCGISEHWHKIRLTVGAKADLRLWSVFLKDFNGVSIIPEQRWLAEEDAEFFTDASGSIGFGGYFKGRWFQGKWPDNLGSIRSIAWLEVFPIVVALVLWGHLLKGKRVILRSDNQAAVSIINKQTSKCPIIMKLVRFMVLQCLKSNILFVSKFIPGESNNIADAISRYQVRQFREAAPHAAARPTPVPEFLWSL